MKVLRRSGDPIGEGVEDMLDALGLPDDIGRETLFRRMRVLYKRFDA